MRHGPSTIAHRVLGECGYLDVFHESPAVDIGALLSHKSLPWERRPLGRYGGVLVLLDDEYSVLTHSLRTPADQRLSAAHELGHYLMHKGQARIFLCRPEPDVDLVEFQARRFAVELMMPTEVVWWLARQGLSTEVMAWILGVPAGETRARAAELRVTVKEVRRHAGRGVRPGFDS